MNPLWLLLIVPTSFCAGFVLAGLVLSSSRADDARRAYTKGRREGREEMQDWLLCTGKNRYN